MNEFACIACGQEGCTTCFEPEEEEVTCPECGQPDWKGCSCCDCEAED